MGRESLNTRVGARLRELRKAIGTQQQWAEVAAVAARRIGLEGYSYQQWARLERGEQPITMAHLEIASEALGVPPSTFIAEGSAPEPKPSPGLALSDEARMVANILDTQGRKAAMLYLLAGIKG